MEGGRFHDNLRGAVLPISSRFVLLFAGLLLGLGSTAVSAQERENTIPRVSPNATISQTIGVTTVEITYGRPSVREREIFGGLVPFGEIWRTGANEATTFTVSTSVHVEGKPLEAGSYGLFTVPGPDTWTVVFNEEASQWGAYNYDSSSDVLRVEVKPQTSDTREMMTFSFRTVTDTSGTLLLHWAQTRVPIKITVNTPEVIRARAEENVSNAEDWREPLRYAGYALENEVLLKDALSWVERSIELEENFTTLRVKAELLAANEQFDQAIETANGALAHADSMDESPNGVDELRRQLESWKSEG